MWSHYAADFNGICIEIDENGSLKEVAKKMIYVDEKCKWDRGCNEGSMDEIARRSLSYKSKEWEYEGEYRVISEIQDKNYQEITVKDITCVYIGYKVPDTIREFIEDKCKAQNIDTRIAVVNVKSYSVEAVTSDDYRKILSGRPN